MNWLGFDKGYDWQNSETFLINKNIKLIKKFLDKIIILQLDYQMLKKIGEKYYSMNNTKYSATQDMIIKLQELKGKTKLKFYQNTSNHYDEMKIRRQSGNYQFAEDPFSKKGECISKIYHEVFLSLKFSQTKPQVKSMNINYYDLY